MMGRNHIITGALAVGWVGAAGVTVTESPPAALLAVQLMMWGTVAPDLDAENAVAVSTWSPRSHRAGARHEKLLPSARGVLGTITPGAHWLSGAMRVVARAHYLRTRGEGDPITDTDPHRKLWHTALGAVVMGLGVALLLSPVPLIVASQWWPAVLEARTADGRWWGPWLTAAPWVGLMSGVVARGYLGDSWRLTRRIRGSSRALGFVVGAVTTIVVGAWPGAGLGGQWPLWVAAVVAGCAIHVAGDKCSKHGCAWWAPFRRQPGNKRWAPSHLTPPILRFRTGFGGEALFVLVGLVVPSLIGWWVLLSARGVLTGWANLWTVLG